MKKRNVTWMYEKSVEEEHRDAVGGDARAHRRQEPSSRRVVVSGSTADTLQEADEDPGESERPCYACLQQDPEPAVVENGPVWDGHHRIRRRDARPVSLADERIREELGSQGRAQLREPAATYGRVLLLCDEP